MATSYKEALVKTLDAFRIPKCYYAIDALYEGVCLMESDGKWSVYVVEKGYPFKQKERVPLNDAIEEMFYLLSGNKKEQAEMISFFANESKNTKDVTTA